MYHIVVEATLAQPGQHFIEDYLTARDLLPGFRAGMRNVALDEQRHIGFGVKLLRDLALEDPEVPDAVADLLREVLPYSAAVFVPPELGPALHRVLRLHARGDLRGGRALVRDRLRAAGMPLESLPGPIPYPYDLDPAERARRGIAMLEAGLLGEGNGAAAARPGDDGAAVRLRRRGVDPRHAPPARSRCSGTSPTPSRRHLRVEQDARRRRRAAGARPTAPTVTFRRIRYDDFVDGASPAGWTREPEAVANPPGHRRSEPARLRARRSGRRPGRRGGGSDGGLGGGRGRAQPREVGARQDRARAAAPSPPRQDQFQSPSSSIAAGTRIEPHERRVERDRHRGAEADLLDRRHADRDEHAEHGDHDQRRRGDRARARREPLGDRGAGVAGRLVALADAREQEHLVVHREAEHDREHERRRERVDAVEDER